MKCVCVHLEAKFTLECSQWRLQIISNGQIEIKARPASFETRLERNQAEEKGGRWSEKSVLLSLRWHVTALAAPPLNSFNISPSCPRLPTSIIAKPLQVAPSQTPKPKSKPAHKHLSRPDGRLTMGPMIAGQVWRAFGAHLMDPLGTGRKGHGCNGPGKRAAAWPWLEGRSRKPPPPRLWRTCKRPLMSLDSFRVRFSQAQALSRGGRGDTHKATQHFRYNWIHCVRVLVVALANPSNSYRLCNGSRPLDALSCLAAGTQALHLV